MEILSRLRAAVQRARREDELPDFLAEQALRIAAQPERYRHLTAEIDELIGQLADYDTYGQTGYLAMGVNNAILGQTLQRLEQLAGHEQTQNRLKPASSDRTEANK